MTADDRRHRDSTHGDEDEDTYKIHVSRVPTSFTEESVQRILEEKLFDGHDEEGVIAKVELIYPRDDEDDDDDGKASGYKKRKQGDDEQEEEEAKMANTKKEHRGFGFVTLTNADAQHRALELGTLRGGRKANSKKVHTMYLRPYADKEEDMNVCYLWTQKRCPYSDECKFTHSGPGGCLEQNTTPSDGKNGKKGKCFAYKKGKCTKGDDCAFSHDFEPSTATSTTTATTKKEDSEKDCINWKTKGKCRKGDKCTYRHDPKLQKAALKKKEKKQENETQKEKEKQPLSVRVFGLNYETTEKDIREFFVDCGKIQDVKFPMFDDSGRSKGYCGVWFSSPKAVAKAVELDGKELMGRWLSIQAGKMYLKQWEEHESNHPPSAKRQRMTDDRGEY
jgi:RNA recognition motif-containing protein